MEQDRRFLDNIRILIVDDKADFRLLTAHFLTRRGAQVFTAKNAFEGLRLVREICPNLVLSDINMPGRSGLQLLADIRDLGKDRGKLPVIAMTAYVLDQGVVNAGFESILRKPFTPDRLLATLFYTIEPVSNCASSRGRFSRVAALIVSRIKPSFAIYNPLIRSFTNSMTVFLNA
jgi:CheY-like chemotaxis protein